VRQRLAEGEKTHDEQIHASVAKRARIISKEYTGPCEVTLCLTAWAKRTFTKISSNTIDRAMDHTQNRTIFPIDWTCP